MKYEASYLIKFQCSYRHFSEKIVQFKTKKSTRWTLDILGAICQRMRKDSTTLENVTEFTNSSSAGSTCCYCRNDYCRRREANWYLNSAARRNWKESRRFEEWCHKCCTLFNEITTKFHKVSNIYNIKFHYRALSILERLSAFRIRKHACVLSVWCVVAKKDETCCSFYLFAFGFEDRRVLYIMELGRLFGRMSLPFSLLLAKEKWYAIEWNKDLGRQNTFGSNIKTKQMNEMMLCLKIYNHLWLYESKKHSSSGIIEHNN